MPAGSRLHDSGTLTNMPPGSSESTIAVAVVLVSAATLALLAPFARVPLARVDAFIPAYEAALVVVDLITAVLLFGQFGRARSLPILVLACGYLFDALIIVPHAMTFPGVFIPQGMFGAGSETAAWLYFFWHGGFALFVVAYVVLARRDGRQGSAACALKASLPVSIAATIALVLGLTLLAIAGQGFLTSIMDGTDYSMAVTKGISPAICILCLAAFALLWPRRKLSTLDLWLFVVMCAWLCDVVLSAVVGSSRFAASLRPSTSSHVLPKSAAGFRR
jgi:two-component system sensor histidine kinase/response regulator